MEMSCRWGSGVQKLVRETCRRKSDIGRVLENSEFVEATRLQVATLPRAGYGLASLDGA